MSDEIWKDIPGQPGYQVSNHARVRSTDRCIHFSGLPDRVYTGRILRQAPNRKRQGRLSVTLNNKLCCSVHRLVAEAFVPNPTGLPQVNHIDNDPTHNVPSNLEWVTHAGNMQHMAKSGRGKKQKILPQEHQLIRQRHSAGETQLSIAKGYGVGAPAVWKIIHEHTEDL